MSIAHFSFPTPIHFGAGSRKLVGVHLRNHGLRRPLLVTDRALATQPVLTEFLGHLHTGLDVGVFSDVADRPSVARAMEGVDALHTHRADCLIGFGSGAALDLVKAIGLGSAFDGSLADFAAGPSPTRKQLGEVPYLVAVPTTSGSGSEVNGSATIDDAGVARTVTSEKLLPRAVFADPEMTIALACERTASTGLTVLANGIEAYLAPTFHPMCDGIALEAVGIAARALPAAVREPHNLHARGDMMMASMMGGVAAHKGLGAVRSCANALGSVCALHDGVAVALMLEAVLRFNLEAGPAKFDQLAHRVGVGTASDFLPWLAALKRDLGLPASLAAVGVSHAQLARLVEVAVADCAHATNPRPCSAPDFERFFQQAM